MTAKKRKIIILSLVFALSCIFGMIGGREAGQTDQRGGALSTASLPILCFGLEDIRINPLYGSINEEGAGTDHESVYPFMGEKLELPIYLLDGGDGARTLEYELRDEKEKRLVARGSVTDFTGEKGSQSCHIQFQNILEAEVYYHLSLVLDLGRISCRYETRIIRLADPKPLTAILKYARDLHQNLLVWEKATAYTPYLETDTRTDKNTLAYVNINGNMSQLSWGESAPAALGSPWITLRGIQGNYAYINMDSLIEAGPEGNRVSLRVRETMDLQYSENAIYWLSYERHAEELWDYRGNFGAATGILLGMQEEENLQRMDSENERFIAFVVAGELYCYDAEAQKLTRVFSFRSGGEHELRTLQQDYRIKIMDISNEGSLEFVVSGYMNGGEREGACGLSYCIYEPEREQVTEQIFLRSRQSPQLLNEELKTLLMKGRDHFLYAAFDGRVLVVDISTGETAVLVSAGDYPGLVVSESGRAFAWAADLVRGRAAALRVVDLKSGESQTIQAQEGEFLRPLGYVRDDLLVGYGSRAEAGVWDGTEEVYPLNRFVILDSELNQSYQYVFEDILVDHLEFGEDKIIIHRFSRNDNSNYRYLEPDVMLRNEGSGTENLDFSDIQDEYLMKLTVLSYARLPSSLRIERQVIRSFAWGTQIRLPEGQQEERPLRYYAYGRGKLLGVTEELGKAIALAGTCYAYVLEESGRLVWCWSAKQDSRILPQVGTSFQPEAGVRQVTGATYRQLYYYINVGIPLYWVTPDLEPQWLIGYEWQNAVLFNPSSGVTYRMRQEVFEEYIARDNNYLWIRQE